MRILFILSGNKSKASSRVRGFWIAEELEKIGCKCSLNWENDKPELLKNFFEILRYDVIIFQKTFSRYHLLLLIYSRILGKKVFVDIDDAPSRINKKRTLKNFEYMVKYSTKVFCGSDNLVTYVNSIEKNKALLVPTSIKIENYQPSEILNTTICIGWIGNGKHYQDDLIQLLKKPLTTLSQRHSLKFKLIGACNVPELYSTFNNIENLEISFISSIDWADQRAVSYELSEIDIGLYPLLDNNFNEFKCGFKALEYMALKIPVVSSEVSINKKIVVNNVNGYLVNTSKEWIEVLEKLISSKNLRDTLGENGRNLVKNKYTTELAAKLIYNNIIS